MSFSCVDRGPALRNMAPVCAPEMVSAVIGPSGAGKSTLASLIPRFYVVTEGAIRIGGVDVRDIDTHTLLSSMSLVFQDVMLLRDTVTENLRIAAPAASDADLPIAARAAQIHDVIERLPEYYQTMLGHGGGLSGGASGKASPSPGPRQRNSYTAGVGKPYREQDSDRHRASK